MTLSVIIVSYNVRHFLEQALLSTFKALQGMEAEVLVVDNDSADGSLDMVRERFPQAVAIAAGGNLGFSRANNLAIRQARGKYILLLNPDTVVEEHTFATCVAFMEAHPQAGGLGVRMIDGSGQFLPESKRGLPTPWASFCKITGLYRLFPRSARFNHYYLGHLPEHEPAQIEILSGAFMLMRAEALEKAGLLDEAFFMYGEDIDLSYRLLKAGYQNWYLPSTTIIHYKGESTKRSSLNYALVFYEAMLIFARKHFSYRGSGLLEMVIKAGIYGKMALAVVSRVVKRLAPALLDGGLILAGLYFLKVYWETNHKEVKIPYPADFMQLVAPFYALVWIYSVFFNGGYDRGAKPGAYVRGVLVGTLIISAVTNFFDDYRFSKALILLGTAWALFAMLGWRLLLHFWRYKNLDLGSRAQRRVVFVGGAEEASRCRQILQQSGLEHSWLGYVSAQAPAHIEDQYLGQLDRLSDLITFYRPDELIFSARDLASSQIMQLMVATTQQEVGYKILPDDAAFIIGSHDKNSQGAFYSVPFEFKLVQPVSRRSKRAVDLLLSLGFLAASPVLMWLVRKPAGFLRNIFAVLWGRKSWVGLRHEHQALAKARLRPGVLDPASPVQARQPDERTTRRMDALYAKDYSIAADINIILSSFRQLGN